MAPSDRTRCVLLAPSGESSAARRQLEGRGWVAHESDEALRALADLCLLERTLASRRAWGLHPAEKLALVIVEPQRWPQLPELVAAARRYVPSAGLWSYHDGSLDSLAEANAETPAAYQGRLPPPPPSITGDEIAMLLDGDLPETER